MRPERYGRPRAADTQIRAAVLLAHVGVVAALLILTQRASVTRQPDRRPPITLLVVPRAPVPAAMPQRPGESGRMPAPAMHRAPAPARGIAPPGAITWPAAPHAAAPPEAPASALQPALPPGWQPGERQVRPWQFDPRAHSRTLHRDARLGRANAPDDADRESTRASNRTEVHVKGGCFEMPRHQDPLWNHPQAVLQNCQ